MSTPDTNPTPKRRKPLGVATGVGVLLLLAAVPVVRFVVEQMQDAQWHR
jgi:hypothetical protein